jgi:HD-GYP domain-containing protein (c-di-GMP phosphodiesterase class II)
MLRVPISYAKPGMVLALPVYHPRRPDTVLLSDGMELDARSIARLGEIELKELWIRYPGVDFVREYICPSVFNAHAHLTRHIAQALEGASHAAPAKLEYTAYRAAIGALLDRLIANPRAAVFSQEIVSRGEPALAHASTVAFLSVLMGLKLDDYLILERSRLASYVARDVTSLGVGAMLHDIGMLRLPPEVVERWNRTQDESCETWRAHVLIGYELVKEAIGPSAAAGVLHHHQKFDGTGFPARVRTDGAGNAIHESLAGSDIHVFARIIAAADLFDRLRHPPSAPGRDDTVPVVRVLRQMQHHPYADWIDPMVYLALLSVVPAYLPGSMVTLSNGQNAVVTEWFPDDPCRPTVQTIGDPRVDFANESRRSERFILRERTDLAIIRAEGQDVAQDNFYPSNPGEFDLKLAGRLLHNAASTRMAPPEDLQRAG